MGKTTIEITDETKDELLDRRLDHETNYDDTITRLLGNSDVAICDESDVRQIVREEVSQSVVAEARQ